MTFYLFQIISLVYAYECVYVNLFDKGNRMSYDIVARPIKYDYCK